MKPWTNFKATQPWSDGWLVLPFTMVYAMIRMNGGPWWALIPCVVVGIVFTHFFEIKRISPKDRYK